MDGEAGSQQEKEQPEGGIIDRRYYRGLLVIPKGVEVVSTGVKKVREAHHVIYNVMYLFGNQY